LLLIHVSVPPKRPLAQPGDGPSAIELRAGRASTSPKCYNLNVTSLRARLHIGSPNRGGNAGSGNPPVFILGIVLMVAVVGGLTLRSVLAASGWPPSADASHVESATAGPTGSPDSPSSRGPTPESAAPTVSVSPYLGLGGYVWPLDSARVTLPFGPSSWGEFFVDGQRFHDGLDIATGCGDNVRAAHDGVVLAAGRHYDEYMGWIGDLTPYHHLLDTRHWWDSLPIVIVIDDGNGYRSIYAHEYQVTVKLGQHVKAGQVIGYEGATGNASGCHVHFGLFSPTETATFRLDPAIVSSNLLPPYEIARIDPLLVLPFRCEVEETRALRPVEAAPCPPLPTPSPSLGPMPTLRPVPPQTATASAQPSASVKP
jgi:murein DD-endopeptidase MepM/ murein hydrolase activator NlpD